VTRCDGEGLQMLRRALRPKPWQLAHAGDQVGMRVSQKLLAAVCSGQNADIPADAGIVAGLQIELRVADRGHAVDARDAGRFETTKDQVRRGPTLRHFITTYDGIHNTAAPIECS
jgi:hypothetical protein